MGANNHKSSNKLREGSVLIITGASSGLGKQLALTYCVRKLRLVITGRNEKRLQQTKKQCLKKGNSQIIKFIGDLTNNDQCKQLINLVIKNYNRIDGIVLNAGINAHFQFSELKNSDSEIFQKLMRTNLYANVNITKYALPYLRASKGRLIVISSLSGKFGLPSRTAYCASKFALTGFFQSLRTEEQNITIILVYPTSLETPMRLNNIIVHNQKQSKSKQNNIDEAKQKREDPKKCAEYIVECVDKGKHDVYLPLKAYFGVVMQPIFPNFIREKLKKAAKL